MPHSFALFDFAINNSVVTCSCPINTQCLLLHILQSPLGTFIVLWALLLCCQSIQLLNYLVILEI